MKIHPKYSLLYQSISKEKDRILHFWVNRSVDQERGGFYGRITGDNQLMKEADKGIVLNSRILWSFSLAAQLENSALYRGLATRAFDYILNYFWDDEFGGVYWMLDANGQPTNKRKQIYAQAFTIYAFAEYYQLTENPLALERSLDIFELLEEKSKDRRNKGYFEAFGTDWSAIEDVRLSDKDANEAKTMNTHLHLVEAYTNLARSTNNHTIQEALQGLIEIYLNYFVDPSSCHLHLFFNEEWEPKSRAISYGHDIESAWLLQEAAEVLGEEALIHRTRELAIKIAAVTQNEGIDKRGGLNYEKLNHHTDKEKHWWVQAEAMVGFLNAYQNGKAETFWETTLHLWSFIQANLLDIPNGEWYWSVDALGRPNQNEDKLGPWKAPYHNLRACYELITRIEDLSNL